MADEQRFRLLENRYRRVLSYGREIVQKLVKSLTAFQVIKQRLKRDTRASEDRGTPEDVPILDNEVNWLHD